MWNRSNVSSPRASLFLSVLLFITGSIAAQTKPQPAKPWRVSQYSWAEAVKLGKPGALSTPVAGDVTGDGTLSLVDANLIKDHLLEIDALTSESLTCADADGDGQITVADVVYINTHPSPPTIAADVIALDNESEITVVEVTTYTLTLTAHDTSRINVGDILSGSAGGGFLRRVLSLDVQGQTVIAQTEQASLVEALESGQFSGTFVLAEGSTLQSVKWTPATAAAVATAQSLTWDMSGWVLVQTPAIKISIPSGTLKFTPQLDCKISVEWFQLKYFRAVVSGRMEFSGQLRCDVFDGVSFVINNPQWTRTLFTIPISPAPTPIAIGPIVIVLDLEGKIGPTLNVSVPSRGVIQERYTVSFDAGAGAEYTNGGWRTISSVTGSSSGSEETLTLFETQQIKAALKLAVGLKFYKLAGPYIKFGPYLLYTATKIITPQPLTLRALKWGLEAGLSLDLKILDILSLSYTVADWSLIERTIWSGSIPIPTPPTVIFFAINNGLSSTSNRTVTLDNACTNNPTQYMASELASFSGATWQTYSTAPSFTLSSGNGTKPVYLKSKNSAGESSVRSDTIILNEEIPPLVSSFAIHNGADATSIRGVTLNNACTNNPTQYMASEASNFSGATWRAYSTGPSFTLSNGNGTKTVYFKVKNGAGESSARSDTITLNEVIPPSVSSFAINSGADATVDREVTLDNLAANGPTEYMASESSSFGGATWQTYSTAPSFTLSSGNGAKTVYFKVKNSAGESLAVNDTITLSAETAIINLPGDVTLEMVRIPAGSFQMGRYFDEEGGVPDEDPQHPVTISQDFYLGKYEVTQAEWQAVMNATPWSGESFVLNDPRSPAVYVSWEMIAGAGGFLEKLNQHLASSGQGGIVVRLPSEAEWEYACRAQTTARFYWGDDLLNSQIGAYAWWADNTAGEEYAHAIGQKLSNGWGLHDMSGNVQEWCQDCWHFETGYIGAPTDGSAWEEAGGCEYPVIRGGGFWDGPWRSAARTYAISSNAESHLGFRIAGSF